VRESTRSYRSDPDRYVTAAADGTAQPFLQQAYDAYFGLARLAERTGDQSAQAQYLRQYSAIAPDGDLYHIADQTLRRLQDRRID
jgi:hypothetical protein